MNIRKVKKLEEEGVDNVQLRTDLTGLQVNMQRVFARLMVSGKEELIIRWDIAKRVKVLRALKYGVILEMVKTGEWEYFMYQDIEAFSF